MKTSFTIFTTLLLFLLGQSHVAAKDINKIFGMVKDEKSQAIPYANVALVEAETGALITGAVSDENGKFTIQSSSAKEMQLIITSLGYKTLKSDVFQLHSGESKDFKELVLEDEMKTLNEVTVRATRPEVIVEADKTTINIEGTVLAEGNTALDVLARSPGVYVDQDGRINLNGRQGVTVMVNDRLTYMSSDDLANFLRSMPADNIKSIEIINNPTARFDAEGGAGIINIKLKKNSFSGVFGSAQIGGNYIGKFGPNANVSINVKKGKWTNTASLNYNEFVEINNLTINRNFNVAGGQSKFSQEGRFNTRQKTFFFNGGSDYEINKNHSVGINIQANQSNGKERSKSDTDVSNPESTNNFEIISNNNVGNERQRIFANLHYVGTLDTLGTKLTADFDFGKMSSSSNSLMVNQNTILSDSNNPFFTRILNDNSMVYDIMTAKVDFIKPFGKGKTLESGLKGSWIKSDNNLILKNSEADGPFIPNPNSNQFIYEENVLAAYSTYKSKFNDRMTFQAGLRTEYSDITGTSVTLNQENKQNYINLFPSFSVQQKVSKDYQIIYNANRRINRPNYRLLNPFIFFLDPLTSEKGNPDLRPQFSNNLEINNVFKGAYQLALGYSETVDAFQQIFTQDEETRSTTTFTANLDKTTNWNARFIFPVEVNKWWNSSNMIQVNHNTFKSLIGDAYLDVAQTSYMLRSQHNLVLPNNFKMEVVGMFLGPQIWGQATMKSFGWVDAGITKGFKKDKLMLTVNGTDLFRSMVYRAEIKFDQIDTNFRQYRNTQGIRFTLRYKFAQGESFRVSNRSGSSEEKNRLD